MPGLREWGRVMPDKTNFLQELDQRRRELGLSFERLALRSGVSRPTVQRILSGTQAAASFSNILSIASCLGLTLRFESDIDPETLRRDQARRKARKLVALVQGTSGLEGQAVDDQAVESMVERTTDELLSGPKRRLWSEE